MGATNYALCADSTLLRAVKDLDVSKVSRLLKSETEVVTPEQRAEAIAEANTLIANPYKYRDCGSKVISKLFSSTAHYFAAYATWKIINRNVSRKALLVPAAVVFTYTSVYKFYEAIMILRGENNSNLTKALAIKALLQA